MKFFFFKPAGLRDLIRLLRDRARMGKHKQKTMKENYGRCSRCGYPVRQCICFRFTKQLLILIALLAIVSCSKKTDAPAPPQPPSKTNVRFFSTNAVTSTKVITAKVNGVDYGTVRYSATQPACDAAGFGLVPLAPGNYTVDYIDKDNPMANKQVQITVVASTTCAFFNLK